jgi:hypothetical protein
MASSHRNNLKSGHESRATQRQKQRLRLEATVPQVIARHAPELSAGQPGAGLDSATLASIVSEICGAGLDADRKATRVLDRVLRAMQRVTQGEVCLPDPVVCLPRKASPFRPQEMARIRELSEAIAAFTSDLTKMSESDGDLPAARILFSAIVFGGLLHRTLINVLICTQN